MGTLTNKERDALEDVFLSIHTSNNSYLNIKDLYSIIAENKISLSLSYLLKRAKFGLKRAKTSHLSSYLDKKKKPLS